MSGYASSTDQKPLMLDSGAGLKKPMDTLIEKYHKEKGVTVIPNYGSAGGLYAQIEKGQPCDLFLPADWLYIDKLKNEGKIVDSKKFLRDHVVLIVSKTGEKKGIKSATDLTKDGMTVAVCDKRAPVGRYTENVLKSLGIWDTLQKKGNIKAQPVTVNQAALMVRNDDVDAAFVFSSTANLYGLHYAEKYSPAQSGDITFGLGTIKGGNEAQAKNFMDYLIQNAGEFERYGWERYA
ncbi:molybdate ABC transporter substrate-binding protein [Methanocella paludicola]|nr:molybdate ABC transporter substrate-binding protein [Methanocella paludicola]